MPVTHKNTAPQTTEAHYVSYQIEDSVVVQNGVEDPSYFVKAEFYDPPEPEVIKDVAAGKALIFLINAHSNSKGDIALIKDSEGKNIKLQTIDLLQLIAAKYELVPNLKNIEKVVDLYTCYGEIIDFKLQDSITQLIARYPNFFKNLAIFSYAGRRFPQLNYFTKIKLRPLLAEDIRDSKFDMTTQIYRRITNAVPFSVLRLDGNGHIVKIGGISIVRCHTTFEELLSALTAYDKSGKQGAASVIQAKCDNIINTYFSEFLHTNATVCVHDFSEETILEWIRRSYAWIALQQERTDGTLARSHDNKLLTTSTAELKAKFAGQVDEAKNLFAKHVLKVPSSEQYQESLLGFFAQKYGIFQRVFVL